MNTFEFTQNMKITLDLKSMLAGLAIGVCVVLLTGATVSEKEVGRYQISTAAGFALVIDTTTGKVWGANLSGANFNTIHDGFWSVK
jgi:D-alanyl-D-alanine carboxypeptidase